MKLSGIALRNVFRNGRRSLLSVTAVAVAALSITLLFALLEGIRADIRHNAWNYESGEVRIRNAEFDRYEYLNPVQYVVPDHRALAERLEQLPQVAALSPRINIPAVSFRGERQISARGIGLDFRMEQEYQEDLDLIVAEGRLPATGTSEAILGNRLARELGAGVGDTVTFLTQTRARTSNAFTVDVVGLAAFPVAALDRTAFLLPIEAAGHYMRMRDAASEVLLKSTDGRTEVLKAAVSALLSEEGPEGMNVASWTEVSGGYSYLQMADVVYRIIALFFFLLGSTVIVNTTMMTIHERTREIGTLSAMGMRGGQLVRLFFTEATYLGIAGSLAGVLAGAALAVPLQYTGIDFGAQMEMVDMDLSTVLYPVLNWRSTVLTFFYSLAVAMLASFVPARRAAKLQPVVALRV
ncbi:MAG: ABC transporter permease [Spirochaetaceae bacterium]|nr:MAG: ABC transporter permease [Spirochaetaceae bacterium]